LSLQLTILKVLAGHEKGRASQYELRHAVSILLSSGSDWTNRMKRLALSVPDLDIFGREFVLRDDQGWWITDNGMRFLALLGAGVVPARADAPQLNQSVADVPKPIAAPIKLIGIKKHRPRRNRVDRNRRSAA
jgi:hypothetical protein